MSYSLNSVKGVIEGILQGIITRVTKGEMRSLDYGSYVNFSTSPLYCY